MADAIAISGAAVSPSAVNNVLYRILLLLTNFRLGQWVQNPAKYEVDNYWPSPLRTAANLLCDPQQRSICFVSDGGHLDNTGLSSLLERRCSLMICMDASDDGTFDFEDLMRVMQASRAKYDLEFEPIEEFLDPTRKWIDVFDSLRPNDKGFSSRHFVALRVRYPERKNRPASDGLLIFAKSTLTGDEPIDMLELKRRCSEFPHDPTSNQFLAPERFEAYVMLGRHITSSITSFLDEGNFADASLLPLQVNDWRQKDIVAAQHEIDATADRESGIDGADLTEAKTEAVDFESKLRQTDPFNAVNVQVACEMLKDWGKSVATGRESDVPLTIVSNWVRDAYWVAPHDDKDHPRLRQELCAALIEIIQSRKSRITSNEEARGVFVTLLTVFGRGVKGVPAAILELSERDDVEAGSDTEAANAGE